MKRPRISHHESISATTQQPMDVFTPFKDRKVPSRQVACPSCPAAPGEPCRTKNGAEFAPGNVHRARRRIAIRQGL